MNVPSWLHQDKFDRLIRERGTSLTSRWAKWFYVSFRLDQTNLAFIETNMCRKECTSFLFDLWDKAPENKAEHKKYWEDVKTKYMSLLNVLFELLLEMDAANAVYYFEKTFCAEKHLAMLGLEEGQHFLNKRYELIMEKLDVLSNFSHLLEPVLCHAEKVTTAGPIPQGASPPSVNGIYTSDIPESISLQGEKITDDLQEAKSIYTTVIFQKMLADLSISNEDDNEKIRYLMDFVITVSSIDRGPIFSRLLKDKAYFGIEAFQRIVDICFRFPISNRYYYFKCSIEWAIDEGIISRNIG